MNSPKMHIHDSNEIMPDFLGKLTVGKYSPEKVIPEMFGRGFTDSVSQITSNTPLRGGSPTFTGLRSRIPSPDPDGLLLDQYLNIHAYVRKDFTDLGHDLEGTRPNSKGSPALAVYQENLEPPPRSPKRVEVPMLSLGESSKAIGNLSAFSGTDSNASPVKTGAFSPSKRTEIPTGEPLDDFSSTKSNPSIAFDDSAPPTAAQGAKRPAGSVNLEIVTDLPDVEEASVENTRNNTAEFGMGSARSIESAVKSEGTPPAPPISESGRSFADLSPALDLFEHKSVEGAVPPYVLRSISSAEPKSPSAISAVVVKEKGFTLPSPGNEIEATDAFDMEFGETGRSLGQESTMSGKSRFRTVSSGSQVLFYFFGDTINAGLSDSVVKSSARGGGMTRAMILREQMNKSNAARMEYLAKKQAEVTRYTSKTLAGGSNGLGGQG